MGCLFVFVAYRLFTCKREGYINEKRKKNYIINEGDI